MTHREYYVQVKAGVMWVDGLRCMTPMPAIVYAINTKLGKLPQDTEGYYVVDDYGSYFTAIGKGRTP